MATVARMSVRILADTSDFDKGMTEVEKKANKAEKTIAKWSKGLDESNKGMAKSAHWLGENADAFERMEKRMKSAANARKEAMSRLAGYTDMMDKSAKALGGDLNAAADVLGKFGGLTAKAARGLGGMATAALELGTALREAGLHPLQNFWDDFDKQQASRQSKKEATEAAAKASHIAAIERGDAAARGRVHARRNIEAVGRRVSRGVGSTQGVISNPYTRAAALRRAQEFRQSPTGRAIAGLSGPLAGFGLLGQAGRYAGGLVGDSMTERHEAYQRGRSRFDFRGGFGGIAGRASRGARRFLGGEGGDLLSAFRPGLLGTASGLGMVGRGAAPFLAGQAAGRPDPNRLNRILEAGSAEGIQALRANQRGGGKDTSENIMKIKDINTTIKTVLDDTFTWIKDHGTETIGL